MGPRFLAAALSAGFIAASGGCSLFVSLDGLSDDDDAGQASSDAAPDGNASDASEPEDASDAASASDADASSSAYASAILADLPLAYFHLDETSGTTLADSSGHHHDATSSTVLLGQPGAFLGSGTCVHFDGTAFAQIPDSVSSGGTPFDFTATAPFSLEAWVKLDFAPDGGNDSEITFLSKEQPIVSGGYHGIDFFDNPVVQLQREDDPTSSTQASATNPMSALTWHYLVGTYDGSTISLYIDNTLVGQSGSSTTLVVTNVPFLLGAEDPSGTSALIGSMDEVAIYTTALTLTQRTAHFHAAGK